MPLLNCRTKDWKNTDAACSVFSHIEYVKKKNGEKHVKTRRVIAYIIVSAITVANSAIVMASQLVLTCPQSTLQTPLPKKKTTVLVYMAGDNGLNEVVEYNIREMLAAGSSDEVNLLVHLHTKFPGHEKISKRLHLHNDALFECGTTAAMDSGDLSTLYIACEWALNQFPAEHFILVLWGSAAGPHSAQEGEAPMRSTCYDSSTGSYLSDGDLREGLRTVCANCRNGTNIDIVAFDSCLQSGVEIAYAIRPHADIMVATQAVAARNGYNYTQWLQTLYRNPSDMRGVATGMVEAYEEKYKETGEEYALSAIDLTNFMTAVMGLHELSSALTSSLRNDSNGVLRTAVRSCATAEACPILVNCALGEWIGDIDAIQFCRNLRHALAQLYEEHPELPQIPAAMPRLAKRALRSTIIACVASPQHANTNGLSIYVPTKRINSTYPQMLWAQRAGWLPFLQELVKKN